MIQRDDRPAATDPQVLSAFRLLAGKLECAASRFSVGNLNVSAAVHLVDSHFNIDTFYLIVKLMHAGGRRARRHGGTRRQCGPPSCRRRPHRGENCLSSPSSCLPSTGVANHQSKEAAEAETAVWYCTAAATHTSLYCGVVPPSVFQHFLVQLLRIDWGCGPLPTADDVPTMIPRRSGALAETKLLNQDLF